MDQLVRDEVERLDSTVSKTLFIGTTFENIAKPDWTVYRGAVMVLAAFL